MGLARLFKAGKVQLDSLCRVAKPELAVIQPSLRDVLQQVLCPALKHRAKLMPALPAGNRWQDFRANTHDFRSIHHKPAHLVTYKIKLQNV